MQNTTPGRRGRIAVLAASAVVVAPMAVGTFSAQADEVSNLQFGETKTYIVQLADDPVVAFDGGHGLAATAPKAGQKVDVDSAAARAYTDYLGTQRSKTLKSVGLSSSDVVTTYEVALNGFAVKMNGADAAHMRKNADVVNVWEDEVRYADTVQTPEYLGLTGEGGVWANEFGGFENAGDGVVVGVIDTGIDPTNPSFAPDGMSAPPSDWSGNCDDAGTDRWGAFECNNKIIGARWYGAAFGNTVIPDEYASARDLNGHGSHTAGTSAGDHGVPLSIMGTDLGLASGMAPKAHIAAYKALWMTADGNGSGTTAGLVAAINDAVSDGVDVINYSISGSSTNIMGADEIAFLYAADAGVFVSTSAGNSGDTVGESSVAHNAPWTMTVAASTHDRGAAKTVTLGEADAVKRVSGKDRYATAAAISGLYPDASTVYVASGYTFADALTGSAAAGAGINPGVMTTPEGDAAPVLLVAKNGIPQATADALDALNPSEIIVLGGSAAVSTDIAADLAAWAGVTRIGGADRYETSALLAQEFPAGLSAVYVASGKDANFPDALASSALAGHEGVPVLLTRPTSVPSTVADTIDELAPAEVVVVGGTAAVSNGVYATLGADKRLSGKDRWATNVAITAAYEAETAEAFVASGLAWPDALTGAAYAGYQGAPLVLTRPTALPGVIKTELTRLSPADVTIFGGTAAVGQTVEDELNAMFSGSDDGTYDGVGVGDGVTGEVVNSEDIPDASSNAADAKLCLTDSVDDAGAAGKIVLCTRGVNARTLKSQEVLDSGGIGMILANSNDAESLNADFHFVPSIHVDGTDGDAIKAYVASEATPMATISAQSTAPVNAPEMAGFSSYGPALAGGGDLLKPDITGPGVDIAAAYAADPDTGEYTFDQISGTSMSAPHIAGLGALMKQKYPDWSPAAIKSAMMTTARDTDDNGGPIQRGGSDATPLDFGAGEVQPIPSYNAGLVYEAGWDEWMDYACAIGQNSGCVDPVPAASDLNYPSIAIGALPGSQTVTRTVTDVTGEGGTYTFDIDAPMGVDVTVSPETLTVPADGTASYQVTMTATTAEPDVWAFGQLRLVNGDITVESPIAVRPLSIAASAELNGEGASGEIDYQVTPGFEGTLSMDIDGLIASDVYPFEVTSDGPSGGGGIGDLIEPITVPAGTKTLRVSLFDSEITPGGTDMDLYLAGPDGFIIAESAVGGSDESVTLHDPVPGTYLIAIDYWSGDLGDVAQVPTHVWLVSDTDEGNMTVSPETASASSGEPIDLTVAWNGLAAGSRYLGNVNYLNGSEVIGKTIVSVVVAE